MTIEARQVTMYYSNLTGSEYHTMADACRAEFCEMLAQALESDGAVDLSSEGYDAIANFMADRYKELWMPKIANEVITTNSIIGSVEHRLPHIGKGIVREVLFALFGNFEVTVGEKQ